MAAFTMKEELRSCNSDPMVCKACNMYSLALTVCRLLVHRIVAVLERGVSSWSGPAHNWKTHILSPLDMHRRVRHGKLFNFWISCTLCNSVLCGTV